MGEAAGRAGVWGAELNAPFLRKEWVSGGACGACLMVSSNSPRS